MFLSSFDYTPVLMFSRSFPSTIGIIPARFASTRFPGKPLAKILDKSLIHHTYDNAKKFKELKDVIVATDDKRIFEHVRDFGGKVVMTSPHCKTGTDRLAEVIKNNAEFENCDYVFNIQGDEPFLEAKIINEVVKQMIEDKEAHVGTAVTRLHSKEDALNPSVVKCVVDLRGNALYFSRSLIPFNRDGALDLDSFSYYRHLGVYCYTPEFLLRYEQLSSTPLSELENLEQLKVLEHGYRIKVAILNEKSMSLGVDTPEDIEKIERFLCI